MQKGNEKAKNTAVEINVNKVNEWEYIPCKSYGPFMFHDRISKYLDMMEENFGYIYYKKSKRPGAFHDYDIPSLGISLLVRNRVISVIRFEKIFMFRGYNLIKMDYSRFIEIFNVVPDDIDYKLPVEQKNGRCKWQDVYDFDSLGLQLWVWRDRIVTVMACRD